jgi:hypothetical protein
MSAKTGSLISTVPDNMEPFYKIKKNSPNQLYFFLGYHGILQLHRVKALISSWYSTITRDEGAIISSWYSTNTRYEGTIITAPLEALVVPSSRVFVEYHDDIIVPSPCVIAEYHDDIIVPW